MLAFLVLVALVPQRGDVTGEEQPPLLAEWRVPIPKALSAEEELATFRVDDGLVVELVACEPLVVAPVCAVFDERGRLWVCEMRTYMQDADGAGEADAKNAVVVLTDRDGDGRMDERAVFLDELALPRAVAPTRGGALILAPPRLLFARDEDGDGRADDVRTVDTGLQGISSPEHAINGLLYSLDNHFVCANAPWRYRWNGDTLERSRTAGGGQWGITEDRYGRIYYNDNSNPLRCDLYPSHYAVRNPNLGVAPGMGVDIAKGSRPSPSHLTPGVNRGYRKGLLADGRLHEFTGACAPWIYEGDALPERYQGDAFVCEPCGNLVHRFEISYDERGYPKAETAAPDGAFLTSTDERFRPVFLNEGPDGALYVVDIYRGVLQHRLFVTSWLRAQMEERELETPIDRGRIWRVARKGAERKPMPDLTACSWTELAQQLGSTNRWRRKTAQRLLVEEGAGERDAVDALTKYVRGEPARLELGRLQALWALNGLGKFDRDSVSAFVGGPGSSRAPFSVRLLEPELRSEGEERTLVSMTGIATSKNEAHGWQALLVLSGASTPLLRGLRYAVEEFDADETMRGIVLAGMHGRELEFIDTLGEKLSGHHGSAPGSDAAKAARRRAFLAPLAGAVVRDGRTELIEGLLQRIVGSELDVESQVELALGALAVRAKDAAGRSLPIRLSRFPAAAAELEQIRAPDATLTQLFDALIWPGKPGTAGMWPRDLTDAERERFDRGRSMFEQNCASCHQISGLGDIALAPPLRNSRYVLGPEERLAKILLHGLRGPITFDNRTWDGEMPSLAASDDEIASVLTYLRRAWHHTADPIEPAFVRSVREQHASRKQAWSVNELGD